jgi:peroxiredoxin Q/BCP
VKRRRSPVARRLDMLKVGTTAPDFALPDQDGRVHRLADKRGSWVVLYFYPKDDTPGCTKEACAFRDAMSDLGDLDAVVLGVSADDEASHREFASKYGLNFPLLADVDRRAIEAYEAWGEKEHEGVRYEGIGRGTYLVDPAGRVAETWLVTDPEAHAAEVREALARHAGRVSA